MKKIYALVTLLVIILLASCNKDNVNIDPNLIPGKWKTGTEYYVFTADGLGKTWDPADDVTEDEAQQLSWKVTGNNMTIIHYGEMGEAVPKYYTVTALSSTAMTLRDDYGTEKNFSRVQ